MCAADVVLKERRRLVLVPRETPLSQVHVENMLKLARMGVTMLPPVPAFYNHPRSVEDIVDHIVARVLDQFGIAAPFAKRWDGRMEYLARKEPAPAPIGVPAGKD
jgi:4-hydroxy-3-polyprenylbenzoate decarboxylase